MKVLSLEEKAKRYDEALKQIKECTPDENGFITIYPQEIFPELVESEDERIRKELIEYFRWNVNRILNDFSNKECIAWLEKQGEQKPVDYENANIQQKYFAPKEITPHYSIGDVLCDKSCTMLNKESRHNFKITDIKNGMYICDKWSFPISQQDQFELVVKGIKQKPTTGMKLPKFREGDNIQFNGFGHNRYTIKEVCGLSHYINTIGNRMDMAYTDANFEVIKDSDKVEPKFKVGDIVKPKDGGHEPWQIMQVDILNKKYRFKDDYVIPFSYEDNYELVEQKPAEYTLEQAANIFLDALSNSPYNNKPITDAQTITKQLLNFLQNSASYNPDALIVNEQKPAQSDDFEEEMDRYIEENFYGSADNGFFSNRTKRELEVEDVIRIGCHFAAWQKEQSDKELSNKSKQEWSEEDKYIIDSLLDVLYRIKNGKDPQATTRLIEQHINFIESLKERYDWKPSDEQMGALDDVISSRDIKYNILSELWKDLKKIKGE